MLAKTYTIVQHSTFNPRGKTVTGSQEHIIHKYTNQKKKPESTTYSEDKIQSVYTPSKIIQMFECTEK